jgi:hypothetical protein
MLCGVNTWGRLNAYDALNQIKRVRVHGYPGFKLLIATDCILGFRSCMKEIAVDDIARVAEGNRAGSEHLRI